MMMESDPRVSDTRDIPTKPLWPPTHSSLLSRLFFCWMNNILWRGFKNKYISQDELYDIDDKYKSNNCYNRYLNAQTMWLSSKKGQLKGYKERMQGTYGYFSLLSANFLKLY
eukprot:GHVR01047623.1.p1 GENE.GHVR01047623.1~~GHVR01047623.1.p1  ORF type:complete len:112 (+),score=20.24 GHVR01047623.1:48-383(+)